MRNIVIGRYVPGSGFLYRLDPRAKLLALIILIVAAFLIDSFLHMAVALAVVLLLLLAGRISVKRVYLGLRPIVFLLIFTFIFQVLFNRQGELLFELPLHFTLLSVPVLVLAVFFWGFTKKFIRFRLIYFIALIVGIFALLHYIDQGIMFWNPTFAVFDEGLQTAFFIMLRLIIIVTLSTILTITTKPTDLNLGLEHILKPLKIFRLNTEEIAMIIAISLRYIPTLLDEANKIMLAQASRGVDFKEGNLKEKVMQVVSLLVPMFIISFQRSDDLANAMEARSFVPGRNRTRLHVLTWRALDTACLLIVGLFFMAALSTRWL